ncbi:hypothetical protein LP420_23370 [Massilia sp. B-10]|nr:hypothetical protein LP420_23370 [Massilia sp. B-10]
MLKHQQLLQEPQGHADQLCLSSDFLERKTREHADMKAWIHAVLKPASSSLAPTSTWWKN